MVPEQLDEIFAQTLTGDYDDELPWKAVRTLRSIGTRQIFDRAAEWCSSENLLRRARGIDVLAQIGTTIEHPHNNFPDESFLIVSKLAQRESDPLPLLSAIHALGHIGNPLALPFVIQNRAHESPEVRFAVACALRKFADDQRAVQALMGLMRDADEDVRDWATFGLGVLGDEDSSEIRDALCKRITDPNRDVREEAILALSKRNELRVVPALLAELNQPDIAERLKDAAESFLDDNEHRIGWSPNDYAAALRKHFSLRTRLSPGFCW
jgi:HEAT repeat protein